MVELKDQESIGSQSMLERFEEGAGPPMPMPRASKTPIATTFAAPSEDFFPFALERRKAPNDCALRTAMVQDRGGGDEDLEGGAVPRLRRSRGDSE